MRLVSSLCHLIIKLIQLITTDSFTISLIVAGGILSAFVIDLIVLIHAHAGNKYKINSLLRKRMVR